MNNGVYFNANTDTETEILEEEESTEKKGGLGTIILIIICLGIGFGAGWFTCKLVSSPSKSNVEVLEEKEPEIKREDIVEEKEETWPKTIKATSLDVTLDKILTDTIDMNKKFEYIIDYTDLVGYSFQIKLTSKLYSTTRQVGDKAYFNNKQDIVIVVGGKDVPYLTQDTTEKYEGIGFLTTNAIKYINVSLIGDKVVVYETRNTYSRSDLGSDFKEYNTIQVFDKDGLVEVLTTNGISMYATDDGITEVKPKILNGALVFYEVTSAAQEENVYNISRVTYDGSTKNYTDRVVGYTYEITE